jgi:hypothetical protein
MVLVKIKGPGRDHVPNLGLWAVERVRGIEPPLSTWESYKIWS